MGWVAVLALAALASISVSVVVDAGLSVWRGAPSQRAVGVSPAGVPGGLLRPDHGVVTVPSHPATPKTHRSGPATPGPAAQVTALLPEQPAPVLRPVHHRTPSTPRRPAPSVPPVSGPSTQPPPVVPPQIPVPRIPVPQIPVAPIPVTQVPVIQVAPTVPVVDLPGQPAIATGKPAKQPKPPKPPKPDAAQKLAAEQAKAAQKLAAEQAKAAQKLAAEQAKIAQKLAAEQAKAAAQAAVQPAVQPQAPVVTTAPVAPDQTIETGDSAEG